MKTEQMIAVMQAFADGKEIQGRHKTQMAEADWLNITAPVWDWAYCEYRVKPKEPRVFYLAVATPANSVHKSGYYEAVPLATYEDCKQDHVSRGWEYIKVVEELT